MLGTLQMALPQPEMDIFKFDQMDPMAFLELEFACEKNKFIALTQFALVSLYI
jgi:hypothetical protein